VDKEEKARLEAEMKVKKKRVVRKGKKILLVKASD
jgi:hypothetical protein